MARIKLDLPSAFLFSTSIAVRITDLNYGGHVGNDALVAMVHEARLQFIRHLGYTDELNFGSTSLIMADLAVTYKAESFYGDVLKIEVTPADLHKYGFDLLYLFTNAQTGQEVARAKSGMVCFDYQARKIALLPDAVKAQFETKPA